MMTVVVPAGGRYRGTVDFLTRFWSRVDVRGPDECWEWTGSRLPRGYGTFGRGAYAHRTSYEMAHGPLGDLHALHSCDNPPCVNPAHLFAGDALANGRDAATKGRMRSGSRHGLRLHPEACRPARGESNRGARLTAGVVIELRQRRRDAGTSFRVLAREYGISLTHVQNIVARRKWAHVD